MSTLEPKHFDDTSRLEVACEHCGMVHTPECPKCHRQYTPQSTIEDYGFRPGTEAEMLARFAGLARYIASKRNAKFLWGCFLMATGDAAADGISMSDFAKEWKVTKACVSKACVEICSRLGIAPSRYMKREETRAKFKESNVRKRSY